MSFTSWPTSLNVGYLGVRQGDRDGATSSMSRTLSFLPLCESYCALCVWLGGWVEGLVDKLSFHSFGSLRCHHVEV